MYLSIFTWWGLQPPHPPPWIMAPAMVYSAISIRKSEGRGVMMWGWGVGWVRQNRILPVIEFRIFSRFHGNNHTVQTKLNLKVGFCPFSSVWSLT